MNTPPSDPDPRPQPESGDSGATGLSTAAGSPPTESLHVPSDFATWSTATALPVIEGYVILRELHHGGQGVVFEAVQKSTNRKVAVKMLLQQEYASDAAKKRIEREVKLIAQLRHPNIIAVHDSGVTPDGRCYFVMDYVRGAPLRQYIRERRLPLDRVLDIFARVCAAVDHAHQRGVIHRDLKPSNIMVDDGGVPFVLDFGLAKSTGATVETLVSLTGQLIGTWPYMSPEQTRAKPEDIDARSDVYALGVVLYELVTGRYPYPIAGTLEEVLKSIRESPPASPSRAWDPVTGVAPDGEGSGAVLRCPVDKDLDTILLKALAKEPQRRYQSAGDLARDLEHYRRGEPIEARRTSTAYLLRKRGKALIQQQKFMASATVVVLSTVLALIIAARLIYRWTPLNAWWERIVIERLSPTAPAGTAFGNVRVIALMDETDVEGLASRYGMQGVSVSKNRSLRRLHGRLMERLALSGCRAVAWDLNFPEPTEFDQDFVRGVEALAHADVSVVVRTMEWWLGSGAPPDISPQIAPHVRWGSTIAGVSEVATWRVQLVAQRGPASPQPSLALAAYAACQSSRANVDFAMNPTDGFLDFLFWRPDPVVPHARQILADPSRIDLSFARPVTDPQGDFPPAVGLQPGDIVGFHFTQIPDNTVLASATLEYAEVLNADDAQLRAWLAGKCLILNDMRGNTDRHRCPDGRTLSGVYVQASAIDSLFRTAIVRLPREYGDLKFALLGALIGSLAVAWSTNRPKLLGTLVVTVAVLIFLASFCAFRIWHYLFNPMLPLLASVLAAAAATLLRRLGQGHVHILGD